MSRTVYVTSGAVEYVWANVTETSGLDISGDTVAVSLGTSAAAGVWQSPDITQYPVLGTVRVGFLVGQSIIPAAGNYQYWVKVGDSPETIAVRCGLVTVK